MDGKLRAVLFDLDGTLLDTAPDMVGALNALRAEHGLTPLPYETLRVLVSHGAARLLKAGFPAADASLFADLQARYLTLYRENLSRGTRLFDGMDRVLSELARRRLACGIVTNKPGWLTEPLLQQLRLASRFVCVVSGDSVGERKPHPLPMLHAAALAGVAAGDCIYIGDAERDIQAAHAAGMKALVASYGYLEPGEDWSKWGGNGAIGEPAALLTWLDDNARS